MDDSGSGVLLLSSYALGFETRLPAEESTFKRAAGAVSFHEVKGTHMEEVGKLSNLNKLSTALLGIGLDYNPARNAAYLDLMVAVRFELFRICAPWFLGDRRTHAM